MSALVTIRAGTLADAWDERVARALGHAPARLGRAVAWLRQPPRRWLRMGAGLMFILGGVLSILPILGLWMLPLGLALLAEDSAAMKTGLERMARGVEGMVRRVSR